MNDADFEARVRYRRGMDVQALVDEMAADGIDVVAAEAAVQRIKARLTNDDRRRGIANIVFGALLFLIGLVATLWSLTNTGGVFLRALGGLGIGAWLTGVGANQISKAGTDSALARSGLKV